MLVRCEPVLGAGGDEEGVPFLERRLDAFDLEHAAAFEHDVDLVLCVRLLAVRFRRDQHVDADLEPGRGVHGLVAATPLTEANSRPVDVERMSGH